MQKNAARFTGFAAVYESARPSMPAHAVRVIVRYLGAEPGTVVDLGCGTGLSTKIWEGAARRVIGVEPSADMLAEARRSRSGAIEFLNRYAHDTGLAAQSVDVAVCSQSFHWMEPNATLAEVERILRPGGVFATVDCDWPPVSLWQADRAFQAFREQVKQIEDTVPELAARFERFPKEKHLHNLRACGYFRYARELLFSHTETADAERYIGLMLSQGGFQSLLRLQPEKIQAQWDAYQAEIRALFGEATLEIDFSYRMRIAVK